MVIGLADWLKGEKITQELETYFSNAHWTSDMTYINFYIIEYNLKYKNIYLRNRIERKFKQRQIVTHNESGVGTAMILQLTIVFPLYFLN